MSTRALCISVTFLTGRYHGEEWPPSPARLFQALIAGVHTCGYNRYVAAVDPALRVLETLEPPEIVAVRHRDLAPYRISVPNNDRDAVEKSWLAGKPKDPAKFRTLKQVEPKALQEPGPHVQYVWRIPEEMAARIIQPLQTAAHCLHTLGWGIDMAHADLTEEVGEGLAYHPGQTGRSYAVPMPGTVDDLNSTYSRFAARASGKGVDTHTRPSMLGSCRYFCETDAVSPHAAFVLLKADSDSFRAVEWSHAMKVSAWLRHAMAEMFRSEYPQKEELLEAYIEGHTGQSEKSNRISYVPLPSIYGHHNDGRIRRALLVEPQSSTGEVTRLAAHKLMGRMLTGKEGTEECVLGPTDPDDRVLRQYLPRSACTLWRSVTPVVLHGHNLDRRGAISIAKTERLLLRGFEMAGISSSLIEELAFQGGPLWHGARHASAMLVPDHLRHFPRLHLQVRFREPIYGPLLCGVARHYGIGLFAAVRG